MMDNIKALEGGRAMSDKDKEAFAQTGRRIV